MLGAMLRRAQEEIRYWMWSDWSLSDTADHYDRMAAHYDEVNADTDAHFRRFTDALQLAQLPEEARLLEVFARTGEGMEYFYEQGRVSSGVCVDVSEEMGRICRERLARGGHQNWRWVHMTDYRLPLADGEFDVTICLETVEHVSRPDRFVAELARVTRPAGLFVLSTPNVLWEPVHALAAVVGLHHSEGPHRFVSYARLVRIVRAAGFEVMHAKTMVLVPEGPEWLVRWGDRIENRAPRAVMEAVGLRRFLICRRCVEG